MSRTTKLWLIVAPAGFAVGAATTAFILLSNHLDVPRLQAVLTALIGGSFIIAGLIAWTRRPLNRIGPLLIAVGFTWFLAAGLAASNYSLPWTIGVAISAVSAGFLVHLLLAYPSGRLRSRWELVVVAFGYALVSVGILVHLLFDPNPTQCDECPSNAFLVRDNEVASDVINASVRLFAVAFLLAVVATLVRRWRRSSPAARRTLTPVLLAGVATVFLLAIHVATQSFSPTLSEVADRTAAVVLIGVPFLFLTGLFKGRLARADISEALAEEPRGRLPEQLQARVQRLLHDPTAELLLWCGGNVRSYVDVEGNRRELEDLEPGRAVTPIAREGNALAAIVHDEALLDERELVEQVAAAVGLEVERDRNLFDLQASERRSRALLESIPDSMFRISRDGRILDYRVEPPIRLFRPEEGMIGSDVYDTDFPSEITARTMALGEKALATGETQGHEYDVEMDGELHHQEARITPSGADEFLLIVRDVTDRKQQERALQASELRNRALVEAMPDNMFRISSDGVFLDIQESPGPHLRPVQAKVGSSVFDYPVPRELIERVMSAGRLALHTGELQTIEWEIDSEGDLRYQEGRFMPSGENEFFLVVRDVTDRKRQEIEQAALHRVALAVASEGRPEQIFDLVAEEVGHLLRAHHVKLLRYEPGGEWAVGVGSWGKARTSTGTVHAREPIRMPGNPIHLVYETGRPVRVDQETRPELAARLESHGVNSFVAAPITVSGSLWGVVVASLKPPHSFWPGAEERLHAFTRLVSLALANEEARGQLEASRARLVSAGDEERRRLERNLHDGAQQRLVSLSLSLRLAQRKLASDPQAAQELLSAASLELGVALEELRELARGIHPAVLTERGLGPALQSLADRVPLPVELELPTDERLPRRVEAAAYYVVSEALANVAKYAHASAVTVTVARENRFAVVEVADDGVGGADPQHGTGLRGLADRVEALDGTLVVDSLPGEGTRIRAEVPEAPRTIRNRGLAELLDTSHHDSQVEPQLERFGP
jgi:PAS domain S-box-containing protein